MSNYREIRHAQMVETEERFYAFLNREWGRITSNRPSRSFRHECPRFGEFYDVSCMQLDTIMNDLLASEEIYLKTVSIISSQHFNNLTEDATNFWRKCNSIIRSKVREFTPDTVDINKLLFDCEIPTIDSIMRRVSVMEKKYKAGLIKPDNAHITTINVSRNEGVINTGNIYEAVQGKIIQINKSSNDEVLNSINSLLTAIKDMNINEAAKLEHVKNIDFLVSQYTLPKEQKNSMLIGTVLQALSTSSDLISLWDKFGVVITAGFQNLLR